MAGESRPNAGRREGPGYPGAFPFGLPGPTLGLAAEVPPPGEKGPDMSKTYARRIAEEATRLLRLPERQENPETGEKVYPHTDAEGYPLGSNGERFKIRPAETSY